MSVMQVSDDEFRLFQRLVYESSGIYLSPMKRALLTARLSKRIAHLGLKSFREYYRCVSEGGEDERQLMLDSICTNETSFFRDERQFGYLDTVVLPDVTAAADRRRTIRVWSAACSTGEEPFSIAMLLHDRLSEVGWTVQILATDLSSKALDRAQSAEWPIEKASGIPNEYLRTYMLKGRNAKEGIMRAGPTLRSLVEFRRLNLNDDDYGVGKFDIIFCRNVLIYFDAKSKQHVFERLLEHLVPGGYLFLGHAESGAGWHGDLVPVRPAICQYRPAA